MYRGCIGVSDLSLLGWTLLAEHEALKCIPKARCINPSPAQFDNTSNFVFFCCTRWWRRAGGTRYRLVRQEETIVARELFKADGEEEGEGDDYEDLACKGIAEPTPKLASVLLGRRGRRG